MSVAQLYHHMAPTSEVNVIAKALIRLLRSHREVQSVVLNSIASISIARKVFLDRIIYNYYYIIYVNYYCLTINETYFFRICLNPI